MECTTACMDHVVASLTVDNFKRNLDNFCKNKMYMICNDEVPIQASVMPSQPEIMHHVQRCIH